MKIEKFDAILAEWRRYEGIIDQRQSQRKGMHLYGTYGSGGCF
jgi:hypothetical protein